MRGLAVVCFDIGEVLVDETRVWATWARVLGVSALTLHAAIGAHLAAGRSHLDALRQFDPGWGGRLDEFEGALGGLQERDLYPDALPTIARLRGAGWRVAVAGNQPARRSEELRRAGVDGEVVVTSEELGAHKPDGAFFAGVLARLGGPEPASVLYVGDRRDHDIAPARAAGLRTAWLHRGPWAHLAPAPLGAPGRTHADVELDDLGALLRWLEL